MTEDWVQMEKQACRLMTFEMTKNKYNARLQSANTVSQHGYGYNIKGATDSDSTSADQAYANSPKPLRHQHLTHQPT